NDIRAIGIAVVLLRHKASEVIPLKMLLCAFYWIFFEEKHKEAGLLQLFNGWRTNIDNIYNVKRANDSFAPTSIVLASHSNDWSCFWSIGSNPPASMIA